MSGEGRCGCTSQSGNETSSGGRVKPSLSKLVAVKEFHANPILICELLYLFVQDFSEASGQFYHSIEGIIGFSQTLLDLFKLKRARTILEVSAGLAIHITTIPKDGRLHLLTHEPHLESTPGGSVPAW